VVRRRIIASVLALPLWGCWMGQIPYDSPRSVPAVGPAIAGTWRATAASLSDYEAEGLPRYATADAHELVLRSDGTCSARTLFGTRRLGHPVDPTMACEWQVTGPPDVPFLEVQVRAAHGAVYEQMYFIGQDGDSLVLWSHLTDPDAERYAELSRTPAVRARRRTTRCS
jgi:hypothetical protein